MTKFGRMTACVKMQGADETWSLPMKNVFLLLPLVLLAACATGKVDPEFATPTCDGYRECDAKWRAAEAWITHESGQAVAEKTDSTMRTNMTQSPGNYLSVRVQKVPVGDGSYRIEAEMYCARKVGCDPSPWEATQLFNRSVNRSWVEIAKERHEEPPGK